MTNFGVVTSEKHVEFIKKQLPELSTDNILAETLSRNALLVLHMLVGK